MKLQPAADAVPVCVVGVGESDQCRVIDCVEVAETGHRRGREDGYSSGLRRNNLGRIPRNRAVLELRSTETSQRTEAARSQAGEASQVEDRVPLPVSDMTLLARRRHEHGAEPVLHREAPSELLVPHEVLP